MSETTIRPVENIVSGIWKFSDKIAPETLVQLGRELYEENPACYENIHVRRCSKNQLGISFIYRLYDDRPPAKFDACYAFQYRMTDRLKRRFGNDFVGWDIAEEIWAVAPSRFEDNFETFALSVTMNNQPIGVVVVPRKGERGSVIKTILENPLDPDRSIAQLRELFDSKALLLYLHEIIASAKE